MARPNNHHRNPRIKIFCKSQENPNGQNSQAQPPENPVQHQPSSADISTDSTDVTAAPDETGERCGSYDERPQSLLHSDIRNSRELLAANSSKPRTIDREAEAAWASLASDTQAGKIQVGATDRDGESDGESNSGGNQLTSDHWIEIIEKSLVSPKLALLNCRSIKGEEIFDHLYPRVPGKNGEGDKRYLNRGILSSEYQKYFNRCEASSGWMFEAVSPVSGEKSGYIRVKLDKGSVLGEQWEKDDDGRWKKSGKFAKYKSAKASGIQIPFPAVPESIWDKCSQTTQQRIKDELHFWQWVEANPDIPIVIVEGEKKAMCLLSLGIPAIPLIGVYGWIAGKGSKELHPDLRRFAQKGRKFIILFDNDAKAKTRRYVETAQFQLGVAIKQAGCEVKIATLPRESHQDKVAIDDYVFAGGNAHKIIGNAIDFDDYVCKRYRQLNREPDLTLNQRFLDFKIPVEKKLIAIKSPKGTGKTEILANYIKASVESGFAKVLGIGHRVKLCLQTANRLGIKYIEDATLEEMKGRALYLCFDSLFDGGRAQIDPEDYRDRIVILDEADQSLWHLLNSSTCAKRRIKILETLEAICRNAKQIILLSADLDDTTINYYEKLAFGKDSKEKAWVAINEYKGENNFDVVVFTDKNPNRWFNELEKFIKHGLKPFISVSAQREDSLFASTTLEHKFEKDFPNLKTLRMDSATTNDPTHPAFLAVSNPEILKKYDIVIATSVIETGFNIDFEHFDGVWAKASGVISANSVRQSMCRVRPPVPRFVWASHKAIPTSRIGKGKTSIKELVKSERKIDREIIDACNRAGIRTADYEMQEPDKNHLEAWAKMGCAINSESYRYRQAIVLGLREEGHRDFSYEDFLKIRTVLEVDRGCEVTNAIEIIGLRNNFEKIYDRVKEKLKGEDDQEHSANPAVEHFWALCEETDEEGKLQKKKLKINSHEKREIATEEIFNAKDIDDSDYERLKQKATKSQPEQYSLRKKIIKNKFGGVEVTKNLVERDWDRKYYPSIKLHYHFTEGRQFVKEKQVSRLEFSVESGNGKKFLPDFNKNTLLTKLECLDILKLKEILECEEIHNQHKLAKEVYKIVEENEADIKNYLGLKKAKTPMHFITELVKLVGLRLPCLRQETLAGKRERIYGKPAPRFETQEIKTIKKGVEKIDIKLKILDGKAVPLSDGREEFFKAWLEKDSEEKRTLETIETVKTGLTFERVEKFKADEIEKWEKQQIKETEEYRAAAIDHIKSQFTEEETLEIIDSIEVAEIAWETRDVELLKTIVGSLNNMRKNLVVAFGEAIFSIEGQFFTWVDKNCGVDMDKLIFGSN